ncbi:MAG: transporter, partial [Steroidobacter sp.]
GSGLLLSHVVSAGEEGIVTDRPDFVESSDVVGKGNMQIETSISVENNNDSSIDERTYTTPTLIRAGINDRLELRMETDGRASQRTTIGNTTETVNGYSDIALGVKWHFTDGDARSHKPGTAWLLHVDMDTGSRPFRGTGLRPSLRFVAEWDLPNDTGLGIMPGVVYNKNDQHRFVSGILAATYGKQFTPALHGFIELAGQQLAGKNDGGNVITADTGISWLLSKTIQLDASVQRGLTDDTPDWTVAAGFSMKL